MQYTPLTFKQLKTPVKKAIEAGITPFIMGKPAIGKSSFARDLAKEMGAQCFTLQINQLAERSDLIGQRTSRTVDENNNEKWSLLFFPHAKVQAAIEAAKNTDQLVFLFLDEINRTSADITSSVLSFITEKVIGTDVFPDNIRFIAAGNDEGNIVAIDSASITRFQIFKAIPDTPTFIANVENLNPYIEEAVTKYPELIKYDGNERDVVESEESEDFFDLSAFNSESNEAFKQTTAPRTLEYLSKFYNSYGLDQSKSKDELATIQELMTQVDGKPLIAIVTEGAIGQTDLSNHITNSVIKAYRDAAFSNSQVNLPETKLSQTVLDKLKELKAVDDMETYIQEIGSTDRTELLVTLLSTSSAIDINDRNKTGLLIDAITKMQLEPTRLTGLVQALKVAYTLYSTRSLECLKTAMAKHNNKDLNQSGIIPILDDII